MINATRTHGAVTSAAQNPCAVPQPGSLSARTGYDMIMARRYQEPFTARKVLHRTAFHADILAPQRIAEIIAVKHSDLSQDGVGGVLFNVSNRRAVDAEHAATRRDDAMWPPNRRDRAMRRA
jgi:hypothetical protein